MCQNGACLVVLVELTAEGDSEVAGGGTGNSVGGVQRFAVFIGGAPSLADLHVLKARLHTGRGETDTH